MSKVSIGIPVYNRERYIEQCVVSLMEQTYDDIEYVFYDDASTDASIALLEKVVARYPARKSDVKILRSTENRGVGYARNAIMAAMTGDYCMFCDSDDWMELDMVAIMVAEAERTNADIVGCLHYENDTLVAYTQSGDLNKMRICVDNFAVWNKLIRLSIIRENAIKVPDGVNCWDDVGIVACAYALSENVTFIARPLYHYRKEAQLSYTNTENQKSRMNQQIICARTLDKWFAEKGLAEDYREFLLHLKFASKIKMLSVPPRDFRAWRTTFPEANKGIMRNHTIPLPYRVLFWLASLI